MKQILCLFLVVLLAYSAYAGDAVCWSTGDPHYKTFDGLYADLYGVTGDFVLVKADKFAVLTRISYNPTWGNRGVNTAVAIRDQETVLEISNNQHRVNGKQGAALTGLKNLKVTQKGAQFVISCSNGATVEVTRGGAYLNVYVRVPQAFSGKVSGLCGTFDNNSKNDNLAFTTQRQTHVVPAAEDFFNAPEKAKIIPDVGNAPWPSEAAKQKAYDICKAKKITDEHVLHDCMLDIKAANGNADAAKGYGQVEGNVKELIAEARRLPKCVKKFIGDNSYVGIFKVLRNIRSRLELRVALLQKKKVDAEKEYALVLSNKKATKQQLADAKKKMETTVAGINTQLAILKEELELIRKLLVGFSDASVKFNKPTPAKKDNKKKKQQKGNKNGKKQQPKKVEKKEEPKKIAVGEPTPKKVETKKEEPKKK